MKINNKWKIFFSKALQPKNIINTKIQLTNRERQTLLYDQENKQMGDDFNKDHNTLGVLNVNGNTILIHDNYEELNKLCFLILEYNISIVGFQEVNLNLLQSKIRDNITNTI